MPMPPGLLCGLRGIGILGIDVGVGMEGGQLELRWRVHGGQLLLRRRHMRALEPLGLPDPLMGWIHERLEWALGSMLGGGAAVAGAGGGLAGDAGGGLAGGGAEGAGGGEGVLVLRVDAGTEVTMTLEGLREKPRLSRRDLVVVDGFVIGVRYEGQPLAGTVWLERCADGAGGGLASGGGGGLESGGGGGLASGGGGLYASCDALVQATDTLAGDLAQTLGLPLHVEPVREEDASAGACGAVFFVSDEFGFIVIDGISADGAGESSAALKLKECFDRLWGQ